MPLLSQSLHNGLADATLLWSFFLGIKDIAKAHLPLTLRPRVHTVAKCTAATALGRYCPDLIFWILQHPREHLEAGAAEMLGDVLHDDRVAKVRLVAAIFAQRLGERNPRPAFCHRLAVGEFLEDAGDHRLDGC